MSVVVTEVSRGRVSFDAHPGHDHHLTAEDAVELFVIASKRDNGLVLHHTGYLRRDDLLAVVSRLAEEFPCEGPAHHLTGTNFPGLHDMGGAWFCRSCCSAAQGSHHDDKERDL